MAFENHRVPELARRAQAASMQGRAEEAVSLWSQIAALAPNHPDAKLQIAINHLNIALARRKSGDTGGELEAYDKALSSDPYCYPAILGKAELLERLGKKRQAARLYKDALVLEPPREQMPAPLAAKFARAHEAVQANSKKMSAYLESRMGEIRQAHSGQKLGRFDACVNIALGTGKAYPSKSTLLHYPALPAIEFYDEADFPQLAAVEAKADVIRRELIALLEQDSEKFEPYVTHKDGVPLNQWAELNYSPRWSAFFLWKDGKRIDDHCARCPETASILENAHMADVPGYAPTAFFSLLKPHTHIPPHTGVTNTRLIVHLPLIVPENCRFRVGNETRQWQPGRAWVFDDTIEHEAWNDSDTTRVILIYDLWNLFLTAAEKELIGALLGGMDDYYRSE